MRKPLIRAAAGAIAATLLLIGCGGRTEIDAKKAERFVSAQLVPPPRSVDCPSGVEARKGGSLKCKVVSATGKRYEATLSIRSDKGTVSLAPGAVRELP